MPPIQDGNHTYHLDFITFTTTFFCLFMAWPLLLSSRASALLIPSGLDILLCRGADLFPLSVPLLVDLLPIC